MLEAGRDPRRLLRGQQVVGRGGLDLDHAADRVLDLVHLVGVPAGDQPVALVEVAAGERAAAAAQLDTGRRLADSAKSLSESAGTVTPLEGTTLDAMNIDDLILVSIDDHVVEPPDMFLNHVPAKYKDEAPIVVTDDNGVDQWIYQGRPRVSAASTPWCRGRPRSGAATPPASPRCGPGVYDVHERVRDMDRNGILASMCFPTFTGFCARHLNMHREDVTLVMVSAYNDWHIDEWAGTLPGPLHPARDVADVEPRGDGRRDPPGGGQGLPGGHHAGAAAPRGACPATTTTTTGARSSGRCRRRTW